MDDTLRTSEGIPLRIKTMKEECATVKCTCSVSEGRGGRATEQFFKHFELKVKSWKRAKVADHLPPNILFLHNPPPLYVQKLNKEPFIVWIATLRTGFSIALN